YLFCDKACAQAAKQSHVEPCKMKRLEAGFDVTFLRDVKEKAKHMIPEKAGGSCTYTPAGGWGQATMPKPKPKDSGTKKELSGPPPPKVVKAKGEAAPENKKASGVRLLAGLR
ncbi:hypothetical protein CYMTET_21942, partial [Cymbomonas tetramitiformis]